MGAPPSAQELMAIHLQYHAGTEALSVRAIGQLVAKVLFAGGNLVSKHPNELAREAAQAVGVAKISRNLVEKGLAFLKSLGFARPSKDRWLLTDVGYSTIDEDVQRAKSRVAGVLARHFAERLHSAVLAAWFTDAAVQFYGIFGAQWAAAFGRKSPSPSLTREAIQGLLTSSVAKHGLRAESQELTDGFFHFLLSQQPEDWEHHWHLGQALLAARLVAINVGPDPVTAREFEGALLLLDTNTLLVTALESHRLAEPLERLGKVLELLHVELGYIEATREEYRGAVVANRRDLRRALEAYPRGVLRESSDPFVSTALERGCSSTDDFEQFFDALLDPPETLGDDVPLSVVNDPHTVELAAKGEADASMKEAISKVWRERRGREKRLRAAEHDASLATVAEGLTKAGRRCVVLTLDRTMHEFARMRAGRTGLPQWIALDALIQVLAVDNAGPMLDPSDFAPLMASIIRHQCEPMLSTYTPEDLAIMLDVEDRCAGLTEPEIKRIATAVARERLHGRDRNDPEVSLAVHRAFESAKVQIADDNTALRGQLRDRDAEIRGRDQTLGRTRVRSDRATDMAVSSRAREIRHDAYTRGVAKLVLSLVVIVGWAGGSIAIARRFFPTLDGNGVGLLSGLLSPLLGVSLWLIREIKKWRTTLQRASEVARAQIEDELGASEHEER